MAERKLIPGPGNPVFMAWVPNFTSALRFSRNVVFMARVNLPRPNQIRPPGFPRLKPSDFGGPSEYDGTNDQNSWNAWRKSIADVTAPAFKACMEAHCRACARGAADIFEYCGYTKGSGSHENGLYGSALALDGIGYFINSKATDAEWFDVCRLYAHPSDGAQGTRSGSWSGAGAGVYPDNVQNLKVGETWYLPGSSTYPNMAEINAARLTPWCQAGIAETAYYVEYFAGRLREELDARGLIYPAELVIDIEQSPIHWTLGNLVNGEQVGNINNVRADPRYNTATVYEKETSPGSGVWVPVTYAQHFADQVAADMNLAGAVTQGRIDPFVDYYYRAYANNDVSKAAQGVYRMLWRLYRFAYDYADHKGIYEPWKKFFPASKCAQYENWLVSVARGKPRIYGGDVTGYAEILRADINNPTLYPTSEHAGYAGHADAWDGFLAHAKDVVDQCDQSTKPTRAWIRSALLAEETVNGMRWGTDRFARFVKELHEVGCSGFYLYNEGAWDSGNDVTFADAVSRSITYTNRFVRGTNINTVGIGRRR